MPPPVTVAPPPQAPVITESVVTATPPAPDISTPRLQIGSQLAQYLLLIIGGSIVIFVLYLGALDIVTSSEVTQVYNRTFQQMEGMTIPHDASGADDAAKVLQAASRSSSAEVSVADARKVRSVVDELKKSGRVTAPNAARLDACVQYAAKSSTPATAIVTRPTATQKSATAAPSSPAPPPSPSPSPAATLHPSPTATVQPSPAPVTQPSPTATVQPSPAPVTQPSPTATVQPSPAPVTQSSPTATVQPSPTPSQPSPITKVQPAPTPSAQPSPTATVQPAPIVTSSPTPSPLPTVETSDPAAGQRAADDRANALDECVQILGPLRQVSASQAIDLDRLRLMREYAKDAHEHRQAFRAFWLQAAQLVLLNLLLPVLTALLGYIFGSQSRE
jgi:hypothetical protein